MIQIKKSHGNCSKCSLHEEENTSVLPDTNTPDDLTFLDVMYVTDYPEQDDLVFEKIASGKKSEPLRQLINSLPPHKYIIVSSVMCYPTDKTNIEYSECKKNLTKIIDMTNPSLIVLMGEIPCNSLNIKYNDNVGKFLKYKTCDVLITNEARSGIRDEEVKKIKDILSSEDDMTNNYIPDETINTDFFDINEDGACSFKIPEKYFSGEYRLVDIQYINMKKKLIYIFRDKENTKHIYSPEMPVNNYYWYEQSDRSKKFLHLDSHKNLSLKFGQYDARPRGPYNYESDIRLPEKHAYDYYMKSKVECPIVKKNVMFFDIELYMFDSKQFPSIEEAKFPINCISFQVDDGPTYTYLLNISNMHTTKKLNEMKSKYPNLKIYDSEPKLLSDFIDCFTSMDIDIITGWNIAPGDNTDGFDLPYIFNRLKTLHCRKSLSPYGSCFIDRKMCDISGLIVLDMLQLYKNLTYSKESSYKLESIAQKILKTGKKKYEGNLNSLYKDDIDTFIEYSITDTQLLFKLDKELAHIALQDELRKASTTTYKGASSTTGLADGLFYHDLKSAGLTMANPRENMKEHFLGAYVREATGGLYDWVIDLDLTSLYPSIICSLNLGPNTLIGKLSKEDVHNYLYNRDEFKKKKDITITIDPIYNSKVTGITYDELDKFIKDNNATICYSGCLFKGHNVEKSVFYNIIKKLFKQRKLYQGMMKESKKNGDKASALKFNNQQMSYKILLNSLYGVLAQEHFRFYNMDLASSITYQGQEIIKFSGQHIDQYMDDENNKEINPNFFTDIEKDKIYLKYCDTDSMFLHMKPYMEKKKLELNVDNINKEAMIIQNYVNKELLTKFAQLHNIDLSESMLDFKNEMVAKRYYSLNVKKKYAMKIISKNGMPVDEIEVKGIEVRRSDFSDVTKEMLNKVIDMILSDDFTVTKVMEYVNSIKLRATQLATDRDPSIFKTVKFAKDESEYKTIPQHIRGMLYWNCLEGEYFKAGETGILFPLRSIDVNNAPKHVMDNFYNKFKAKNNMDKFDVIVVPESIGKLPNYYYVDIAKVLDFAVNDRIDILLEPLIKKVVQPQLLW